MISTWRISYLAMSTVYNSADTNIFLPVRPFLNPLVAFWVGFAYRIVLCSTHKI